MPKPTVGRIVHYVSYGTPNGEYASQCRAAVVAGVPVNALPIVDAEHQEQWDSDDVVADLAVLNPSGMFFNRCPQDEDTKRGGTWHWPEREELSPGGPVASSVVLTIDSGVDDAMKQVIRNGINPGAGEPERQR